MPNRVSNAGSMKGNHMTKRSLFFALAFAFGIVIAIAYSNHFQNSFHFDDSQARGQVLTINYFIYFLTEYSSSM